jgi:tetratricopeptide (TPR) repeat protein
MARTESRGTTRIVGIAAVLVVLSFGCAVSKQEFKRNFEYEPVRAQGTIDGTVLLETSHTVSPGAVEVWKRYGNPQENIDNWQATVAEVLRDDMVRSGLVKTSPGGSNPDLIIKIDGLESDKPEGHLKITVSVLDPQSRAVITRYERQVGLGTSIFEYGENMKRGISSQLASIRQDLLADYTAGKIGTVIAANRDTRAAQGHLATAQAALAAGDYAKALSNVRLARQVNPQGAAPATAAVTLLQTLCDPEGGKRLAEEARKVHPADAGLTAAIAGTGITPYPPACQAQALNREGVALAREGKRPEALAKFQAARQAAPGLVPKASYNAGLLLEQSGKPQDALTAYLEARQSFLNPAEEQDAMSRLTALAQRANLPAPDAADRRYRLGIVRAQQKRYPEAVIEFEAALADAPWLTDAYYNLGLVSDFTGAHAKALQALRTYLTLAPQSPHASAVKTKIVELEDKLGVAGIPQKP